MKIYKQLDELKKRGYHSSPLNAHYYFFGKYASMEFYRGSNDNLIILVDTFGRIEKEVTFSIKKSQFPEIYSLIAKMLKRVKSTNTKFKKIVGEDDPDYLELFKNKHFCFRSDTPADGALNSSTCNCFSIIPGPDEYLIVLENRENTCSRFDVEISTSRSRHKEYADPVVDFFIDLNDVCEEIDEYDVKDEKDDIQERINNNPVLKLTKETKGE